MNDTDKVLEFIKEKKETTLTEVMAHCLLPYPETCRALDELVNGGKIVMCSRTVYRIKQNDEKRSGSGRSHFKYNFD